jgi:hypothetical protein
MANLSKELQCTIPGFSEFDKKILNLTECADYLSGVNASKKYQTIIFDFYPNPGQFGCKPPCEKSIYTVNINTYHFNSILWEGSPASRDGNYYHLFYYYSSNLVQKQVEVLVYDFGGFIAAAGGNLGLCLGFSCLSILFTTTHWTQKALQWIKCNSQQK